MQLGMIMQGSVLFFVDFFICYKNKNKSSTLLLSSERSLLLCYGRSMLIEGGVDINQTFSGCTGVSRGYQLGGRLNLDCGFCRSRSRVQVKLKFWDLTVRRSSSLSLLVAMCQVIVYFFNPTSCFFIFWRHT